MSDDEKAILDATACRLGVSRSKVFSHLVLYHGLCGGDFPLTSKIHGLPDADRDRVTAEIRRRCESNDPAKPQEFRQWVKDTLGKDDPATLERGSSALLRNLMQPLVVPDRRTDGHHRGK